MNKLFYPAIFHKAEEGGFWVSFPDFPECFTDGDSIEDVYEMAVDALGLALTSRKEEGQKVPSPTAVTDLTSDDGIFVLIQFDMLEYQKRHNAKAVKKTLSIPEWMNIEATAAGVNFSQVLQDALLQKLRAD